MDDCNITNHKKTFSLVPDSRGNLAFAGFFISDRYPCNIPLSIWSPREVYPVFVADLSEFILWDSSYPHYLPDHNEMITVTKDKHVLPGFDIKPFQFPELFCLTCFRIEDTHDVIIGKCHQC